MELQLTAVDADTVFFRVTGPLTPGLAGLSHDPLEQFIDPQGCSRAIVLDLERAGPLDSSGVAWLLRWHHRARQAGRAFGVCAPPAQASELLRQCALDRVLKVWPDEPAARADLAAHTPTPGA
jgi:anti-anti-sigma factor